jgi:hypothetical protein
LPQPYESLESHDAAVDSAAAVKVAVALPVD